MPTYDYQCPECQNIQEELHSIEAKVEIKCNKCQAVCKKIFSGGNFVLKGDGFMSYNSRIKNSMKKKNEKMKSRMKEREASGEGKGGKRC